MNLAIVNGSIFDADVEAIVNPANSFLRHGGGLARAIADAATAVPHAEDVPEHTYFYAAGRAAAWQDEQEQHPAIPTGGAGWTSAGALPYKGIVHAVGPIWQDGSLYESALLACAYRSAAAVAAAKGCRSAAFPAISCGIFGFPVDLAAQIAVRAFRDGPLRHAYLYIPEPEIYEAFTHAYRQL